MPIREKTLLTIGLAFSIAIGCGGDGVDTENRAFVKEPQIQQVQPTGAFRSFTQSEITPQNTTSIPGFRHTILHSKFALGKTQTAVTDSIGTRTTGENGVFFETLNGFSIGLLNSDSPTHSVSPFSRSADAHHTHVLDYFKNSGIPASQIRGPRIITHGEQAGSMVDAQKGIYGDVTFLGFTTVIDRQVLGVPVVDSHALARFNASDEVVNEEVWWPDLPGTITDQIASFRTLLANQTAYAELQSKLPTELQSKAGALVIHHPMSNGYAWYTQVTVDFVYNRNTIASFDQTGARVYFDSTTVVSGVKPTL